MQLVKVAYPFTILQFQDMIAAFITVYAGKYDEKNDCDQSIVLAADFFRKSGCTGNRC